MRFADRADAGRRLATALEPLRGRDAVVLGLPRGGVPVAFEVAQALDLPLDVILVRKLGLPFQPEVAMGAIGEGDVVVLNHDLLAAARVEQGELDAVEAAERVELARRAERFRGGGPRQELSGRIAVLVDDGAATGSTMRAACGVAREAGAKRIVVGLPVASSEAAAGLRTVADEVVCLVEPRAFRAVGNWYDDFAQTADDEVVALLDGRGDPLPITGGADDVPCIRDEDVVIPGEPAIAGRLTVPERSTGVVVFAHGSGSSRHSPRNRYVARALNAAGIATLLVDLLTEEEELERTNVFDVDLLADRLAGAAAWLRTQPETAELPLGYFGASTGAAAAVIAAARDHTTAALVSRGGRPDLASDWLGKVRCPTLFIVGGQDAAVLALNRRAAAAMTCDPVIRVVPGATHLFVEPGALQRVSGAATTWFAAHLGAG